MSLRAAYSGRGALGVLATLVLMLAVFTLVLLVGTGSARADVFGPISLVSASAIPGSSGNQQVDYAHDAAISGDGRYVAFDGSFGGRTGVWRRDLQTGAVVPVAAETFEEPATSAPDADLPSISADGRYVSFTTTARLDPTDDLNRGPDVYVRDMTKAPSEEGAYTLASAVDGSSAGLTYEPTGKTASIEFEELHNGAIAAGRTALSADGRTVVFVTTAISNLVGPGTPAMQVVVRNLDSQHTELVSVADDPATGVPLAGQPVSQQESGETYGAVFSGIGGKAPIFNSPQPYEPPTPAGASISADGTTVAWMGVSVGRQVHLLSGEAPRASYTEPLWRRIADGPGAPVRRITGGSDPSNPACAGSGEASLPGKATLSDPCQGPFAATQEGGAGIWRGGAGDPIPRLSGDGYSVVLLANAPLVALGENFGITEPQSDLYEVNMHEGLTRVAALRPLTELAGGDQQDLGENGPIEDLGISPDGSHIAFTTKRTVFPLGSPAYISAPSSVAGMLELFVIDTADDTLMRVSQGFGGEPSEHPHVATAPGIDPYTHQGDGAMSPSFTDQGNVVAFTSTASNLAFGDGNTPPLGADNFDGSDAFVVSRVIFDSQATPQSISPVPPPPPLSSPWRIGVTARSRSDGKVLLYVTVPGAGTISAGAQSQVRVQVRRHGRRHQSVVSRGVASAKTAARDAGGGLTTLTLTLASHYRALAGKRLGLAGTVNVTFAAPHHATLRQSVNVTFHRTHKAKAKAKKSQVRQGSTGGGGKRK
ncbi:MAG TPA: hypothetical protein VMB05_08670 [Solirubrobacteraceae bacterium]|nr:hypothetical protein [Solirubrobacteraceae bacterium]